MIERRDVMPVNFLKKENFNGSANGMRYRMEKMAEGDLLRLCVTAWPEPFGYEATPEEEKIRAIFDFSEEGIINGVKWLNEQQYNFKR